MANDIGFDDTIPPDYYTDEGFSSIVKRHSSVGRDTIIFYACTMEVWHISSYFVIRTRLKDDI